MSSSSTSSAAVYVGLPLPPGTSLSWMPPSSLYCCQKSVSRISAAARNLKIAASPLLSFDDAGLSARALAALPNGAKPTPTPAATPVARNERRLTPVSDFSPGAATVPSRLAFGDSVALRMSTLLVSSYLGCYFRHDAAGAGSFPDRASHCERRARLQERLSEAGIRALAGEGSRQPGAGSATRRRALTRQKSPGARAPSHPGRLTSPGPPAPPPRARRPKRETPGPSRPCQRADSRPLPLFVRSRRPPQSSPTTATLRRPPRPPHSRG